MTELFPFKDQYVRNSLGNVIQATESDDLPHAPLPASEAILKNYNKRKKTNYAKFDSQ